MFLLATIFIVFGCVGMLLGGPFAYEAVMIGTVCLIFGLLFETTDFKRR